MKAPRLASGLILLFLASFLSPAAALSQLPQSRMLYWQWIPNVVRAGSNEPVLLAVKVTGTLDGVIFHYYPRFQRPGTFFDMRDDGQGGDRVPRDSIYSLTLESAMIAEGLRPEEVFRPFVGYVNLMRGGEVENQYSVFAEVINDEIPRLPVTALAADAQRTAHLVNIVDREFATGTNRDAGRITKRLYQLLPDDYDLLNIVCALTRLENAFHFPVKNEVLGTGLGIFDYSGTFGSTGKLLGISMFPGSALFDGAEPIYQHELGHQWINYLRVPAVEAFIPHWPLGETATGLMGFSVPMSSLGGYFPCELVREPGGVRLKAQTTQPVFTDLDLYLMGLLPASEVGDQLIFLDQEYARTLKCEGQLFTGGLLTLRIGDIVSAHGPRVPDSDSSPKRFRIATVVVSAEGLLDDDAMSFYSYFAKRAEGTREVPIRFGSVQAPGKPFFISTGGRATLDTSILRMGPAPTISSITPQSGTAAGSKAVAIKGANFLAGARVLIGKAEVLELRVEDSETIVAITAPHPPGLFDVVVINPDGQSATLPAAFTYLPLPEITRAEVKGKKLLIYGSNFADGAKLYLNGEKQHTRNDQANPSTELIAKKAGKKIDQGETVILTVRNPDGQQSAAFAFARPDQ